MGAYLKGRVWEKRLNQFFWKLKGYVGPGAGFFRFYTTNGTQSWWLTQVSGLITEGNRGNYMALEILVTNHHQGFQMGGTPGPGQKKRNLEQLIPAEQGPLLEKEQGQGPKEGFSISCGSGPQYQTNFKKLPQILPWVVVGSGFLTRRSGPLSAYCRLEW